MEKGSLPNFPLVQPFPPSSGPKTTQAVYNSKAKALLGEVKGQGRIYDVRKGTLGLSPECGTWEKKAPLCSDLGEDPPRCSSRQAADSRLHRGLGRKCRESLRVSA